MNTRKSLISLVVKTSLSIIPISIMLCGNAFAQQNIEEQESRTKAQEMFEVIEINGRKKATGESIQEVPLSVSALTETQLSNIFAEDLTDLSSFAPNAILGETKTVPGTAAFFIRGAGTGQSVQSFQPSVGVFQDGVYSGLLIGSISNTFDVEAIEIMRGPQGTLFGRNVSGGAVSITTNRPSDYLEGRIRAQVGSFNRRGIQGKINLPVSDNLSGLLSISTLDQDGFLDNENASSDTIGGGRSTNFRTAWTYEEDGRYDVTFIAYRNDFDGGGATGAPAVYPPEPGYVGQSQREDFFTTDANFPGYVDYTVDGLTIDANYKLAKGTLTAIYGHREVDYVSAADGDGSPDDFFRLYSAIGHEQDSLEVRYASDDYEWGNFVSGIFLWSSELKAGELRSIVGGRLKQASNGIEQNDARSFFIDSDIFLTDDLTLSVGLRYNNESKDASIAPLLRLGCNAGEVDLENFGRTFDTSVCNYIDDSASWSNWQPKVSLKHKLNDTSQWYASISTGFRSGSYNVRETGNIPALTPADEENTTAYEVGYKTELLDGSVKFNSALFRNDIEDFLQISTLPGETVVSTIVNVGEVRIQGAEFELFGMLTDSFVISANLGLIDAEYKALDLVTEAADPLSWELARVPKTTGAINATYDLEVESGYLTFNANVTHRAKMYAAFDQEANPNIMEPRTELGLSVIYETLDGDWQVSVSGKNLNQEESAQNVFYVGSYLMQFINPGREWSAAVEYRF